MKVKVCGMRDPENVRQIGELTPDMMGFIFAERSPRRVDADTAEKACAPCPAGTARVGVFADQSPDFITEMKERCGFSAVQLHGSEDAELCRELRRRLRVAVIKAISVDDNFDPRSLGELAGSCDLFLFDTKGGGTGRRFDWSRLGAYRGPLPFLIAGGIGAAEVRELRLNPPSRYFTGVDLNSKVETAPAMKSKDLVAAALREARP